MIFLFLIPSEKLLQKTGADVSIIFVPPAVGADAIMEAANAGIKLIVTITEGIPVSDMVMVKEYLKSFPCRLIGPNCPGNYNSGRIKSRNNAWIHSQERNYWNYFTFRHSCL